MRKPITHFEPFKPTHLNCVAPAPGETVVDTLAAILWIVSFAAEKSGNFLSWCGEAGMILAETRFNPLVVRVRECRPRP